MHVTPIALLPEVVVLLLAPWLLGCHLAARILVARATGAICSTHERAEQT